MTEDLYFPKRVIFEEGTLEYPLGKRLRGLFEETGTDISHIDAGGRVTGIPRGKTPQESFRHGKETMVVARKKSMKLQTCKPSAHYQFPLVTSCPGKCQYCYLQTRFPKKPYIKVYVNVDEILNNTLNYIDERRPETTRFEVSSTSDPVAVEHLTGSLFQAIQFFAGQEYGLLRFVTKFHHVESLLAAEHRGRTRIRFSINTDRVISDYEHGTSPLDRRLEAAEKVAAAGYPLGLMIAPIVIYDGWQEDYLDLIDRLAHRFPPPASKAADLTFELVTHRYTEKAKEVILERFPSTSLPMDKGERRFKYGQFGYGKWVYPKDVYTEVEAVLVKAIETRLPEARLLYLV